MLTQDEILQRYILPLHPEDEIILDAAIQIYVAMSDAEEQVPELAVALARHLFGMSGKNLSLFKKALKIFIGGKYWTKNTASFSLETLMEIVDEVAKSKKVP